MIDIFAGLEHDLDGAASKVVVERETFLCEHCNGTGRWRGGRNRHGSTECFACKGKGHFLKSAKDRRKAREQRHASKVRRVEAGQAAIVADHGELIAKLRGMADWNSFAASILGQFDAKGQLSDRQLAAAERMVAKCEARKAERQAARERDAVAVDLSAIRVMFDAALANGLKRPKYRAEGLVISRAPETGKNAGALYVKADDGEYQGKITPDHRFYAVRHAHETTKPALRAIAVDPREAAVRYGRVTGSCSCCGRELTKKESIEAGIGPICATKFGF